MSGRIPFFVSFFVSFIVSSVAPVYASSWTAPVGPAETAHVREIVLAELKAHVGPHGSPYTVNEVTQSPMSFKPGVHGVRTRVVFHDRTGCPERVLTASCLPQEKTVGCGFELSPCPPRVFEFWHPLLK